MGRNIRGLRLLAMYIKSSFAPASVLEVTRPDIAKNYSYYFTESESTKSERQVGVKDVEFYSWQGWTPRLPLGGLIHITTM